MSQTLTGVQEMAPGPSGVEFSEDVDSWRVRGLWSAGCMLGSVVQGLLESRNSFGEAGGARRSRVREPQTNLVLTGVPDLRDSLSVRSSDGSRTLLRP